MDSSDVPAHATPHPLKIFDACRRKNEFVYACAPMVRYSKLAFRQTVHHYGTHLCWTPMILAKEFNRSEFARDSDLTVASAQQQQQQQQQQPPTIVQFGANVPVEFARAASLAAPFVAGVDLNCGCPQGWACAETLGAALMDRRELVRDMVVEARGRLARDGWAVGLDRDMDSEAGRSVSVKIRVHDDLRRTIDFLDTVIGSSSSGGAQHRNVDWITIHPRTRHTPSTTPISTSSLAILLERYSARVPILLSGDVFDLGALPAGLPGITTSTSTSATTSTFTTSITTSTASDTTASSSSGTTTSSRLSGFMSARGLLANPALFAGHASCPWEAVEVLMCRLSRAPLPYKLALHHVQQMTGPGMGPDKHSLLSKKERAQLNALPNMLELVDFLDGAVERYTGRAGGMRRDL